MFLCEIINPTAGQNLWKDGFLFVFFLSMLVLHRLPYVKVALQGNINHSQSSQVIAVYVKAILRGS